MLNLKALKAAAEKATPGPWNYSTVGTQVLTGDSWNTVCELWINKDCRFAQWEDGRGPADYLANAAYIALANPSTILSLIDRCEELEGALRKLRNEVLGLTIGEEGVRETIGNTNWNVLMLRADEANAALSKADATS